MTTTTRSGPVAATLAIDGMTCGHCIHAVTKALSGVPGVTVGTVAVGSATVRAADAGTLNAAVAALDEAGYPATINPATAAHAPAPSAKRGGCCGGPSGCCG